MLPSLPPTEPDVPISSIRFLTGELRSRRCMTPSATRLSRKARRWGCEIESKFRCRDRLPNAVLWTVPPLVSILPVPLSVVVSWTGLQGSRSSPVSRQRSSPRDASLPSIGSRRDQFPDVISTMKALRLPGHVSPVTYLFRFQGPRYLRNSCLAACAPGGVEDAFRARILVQPAIRFPVFSHVDVPGALRFPGNPSYAFASVHDPGRTNDPSPVTVSPVLPLLHQKQRLQRHANIGATARLQHPLPTLRERCCHRPCKARFRLAG
jgi:hypothetical protein